MPARSRLVLSPLAIALVCVFGPSFARAELPAVRFDRMQPLGGAAGADTEVEVIGRDTEDVNALWFDRPGFKAELVKPNRFKITVAGDVPEGTYDVRLVGRFGVSNPRLFAVSHGLTEVAETEPNNEGTQAQKVALNSAINGTSDGNGQDSFKVELKQGQRVVFDCQAQKLESQLDANMILLGPNGQILASNGDYHGRDPLIDFVAPQDGEYTVIVHDLSYRGGYPYRLLITNRPHIENIFPRAVQAGQAVELIALGRNLQGAPSRWSAGDAPLEELRFPFTAPSEASTFPFLEHPSDHSVLPTAATSMLNGVQLRVPTASGGAARPQTLVVSRDPVSVETEPNDDREHAQAITLPAVVSGRFDRSQDADWYTFEVPEGAGGQYLFETSSERIAGRADPYMVVYNDQGNQVAELDDYGMRSNSFDGHLRDPHQTVSLDAKKKYHVLVQDRYSRGGARYQYVLTIRKADPDFFAAAMHSENPGPGGTTIWRGGSQFIDVFLLQAGGFNAPVTMTAENLPQGVHAAPVIFQNTQRMALVLWADADAPETVAAIRLVATAQEGDRTWKHEVRPYTRVWSDPTPGTTIAMREYVIAVRDKAPYSLKLMPEKITVEAGGKTEFKLQAQRLWPEFKQKITVIPLAFPNGFNMGNLDLAADQTEMTISLMVPNNVRPGDYTITVLGQGQVPFAKDPKAEQRPNTLVSIPSLPATITVTAPPKK